MVKGRFSRLDAWTRMRLRSFIEKKKWLERKRNFKYPNSHFEKLGLVRLVDTLQYQQKLSFPA